MFIRNVNFATWVTIHLPSQLCEHLQGEAQKRPVCNFSFRAETTEPTRFRKIFVDFNHCGDFLILTFDKVGVVCMLLASNKAQRLQSIVRTTSTK